MRVLERTELYGDLDEYDEEREDLVGGEYEEGEEEEEEEEEQKDPKQLEYLELRERLKQEHRQRMKKESSSAIGQSKEKKKLPYDNYGSFFGPSQPVIAQRVIEESQSIFETQHIHAKTPNSNYASKKGSLNAKAETKGPLYAKSETKLNVHKPPPKAVNESRMKVQKLRETRDYSFLLSDDADFPAPTMESASRNVRVPTFDARPAQVQSKSKASPIRKSVDSVSNGYEERRRSISTSRPMQTKVVRTKEVSTSRLERPSADLRKLIGSNAGNGLGRPVEPKGPLPKASATTMEKKKASAVIAKNSVPVANKATLSKPQAALQKRNLEPKKEHRAVDKPKVIPKQSVDKPKVMLNQSMPSSKPQMKPPKQMPTRTMREDRPKKRPTRDYPGAQKEDMDDDDDEAIRMIRSMFGYNPKRYTDVDDDVSDMEANFDDIQKEERRSAKIAREEDEREERLIEEEERRMRMRKEAKKRKLSQR